MADMYMLDEEKKKDVAQKEGATNAGAVQEEGVKDEGAGAEQEVPAITKPQEGERQEEGDDDIFGRFLKEAEANKPEDKKEREKRERREKRDAMLYGIADLARAMSNMYFTTQYAPNGYDAKESMSAAYQKRLDRGNAERAKRSAQYQNALTKYGNLLNGRLSAEARAEAARQKVQEKKDAAAAKEAAAAKKQEEKDNKDYAAALAPGWEAAAYSGVLDVKAEEQELDERLSKGEITQGQHDAAVRQLNIVNGKVAAKKAEVRFRSTNKSTGVRRTGSGVRKESIPTHRKGEVIELPAGRYGMSVISNVYNRLPQALRLKNGFGSVSADRMRATLQEFFTSDQYSQEAKDAIRDVLIALRDAQDAATAGGETKKNSNTGQPKAGGETKSSNTGQPKAGGETKSSNTGQPKETGTLLPKQ